MGSIFNRGKRARANAFSEMNRITKFFIISIAIHSIILFILGLFAIRTRKSKEEAYVSIFLQDDKPAPILGMTSRIIKDWMIAPVIKPQMSESAYKDGIAWYQGAIKKNHDEY